MSAMHARYGPTVLAIRRDTFRPPGPTRVRGDTGRPINIDTHHRGPDTVMGWLRDAGFTIDTELVIEPAGEVPGAVILARSDA